MKIEPGKNRLIPARAARRRRRWSVLGEKEGRRWGLGGCFSEPMDIDQGTVVCTVPRPPFFLPFRRAVLMDARLRWQGHSLTPHDVSPQAPLSSAATYRAEWGPGRQRRQRNEGREEGSPSPAPLGQWSLHTLSTTLHIAPIVYP